MSTNPTAESRRPGFWRDITVIVAIFSLAVMGFTSLDSKIDAQSAELRQDNAELRKIVTDTGDKFERLYSALLTERKGD